MRLMLTAAVLLALQTGVSLADDGCDKFAWPMTAERALLAAPNKPAVRAGETLSVTPKGAFVMNLQSNTEATLATYAMPPEHKPKAERWFGGVVRLPAPDKPGIYQVTLSEEAWMDIVQDGRYAHTVGHTGRGDCPGLRKSVRLELGAAPFVLQVSGVSSNSIAVAISPRD